MAATRHSTAKENKNNCSFCFKWRVLCATSLSLLRLLYVLHTLISQTGQHTKTNRNVDTRSKALVIQALMEGAVLPSLLRALSAACEGRERERELPRSAIHRHKRGEGRRTRRRKHRRKRGERRRLAYLDWFDVVSNDNELGLLLFNEGGDVVDPVLDHFWLCALVGFLAFRLCDCFCLQSVLLGCLVFWTVLVHQTEKLGGASLVHGLGELVDGWWDLQTLVEHSVLSLKTHVLWPLDESAEVSLARDVPTDAEGSSPWDKFRLVWFRSNWGCLLGACLLCSLLSHVWLAAQVGMGWGEVGCGKGRGEERTG